jgi:hypothetical protein
MIERIDQLDIEETETQKKEIVVAVRKKSLRIFQAMVPTSAEGRTYPNILCSNIKLQQRIMVLELPLTSTTTICQLGLFWCEAQRFLSFSQSRYFRQHGHPRVIPKIPKVVFNLGGQVKCTGQFLITLVSKYL